MRTTEHSQTQSEFATMAQNSKADNQDTDGASDTEEATLQDLANQPGDKPASEPPRTTPRAVIIEKKNKSSLITQLLKTLGEDPEIEDKHRKTITDSKSTGSFRTRWETWNDATEDTPLASSMHEQNNGNIDVHPSPCTNTSCQKIFERFRPKPKGKSKASNGSMASNQAEKVQPNTPADAIRCSER